jgi:hypothetical protein
MGGTKSERAARRATRWLKQTGGMAYVSPEAFELLSGRLAIRIRSLWQITPLLVLAFGETIAVLVIATGWDADDHEQRFAAELLPGYVLLVLALLLAKALAGRAERRLGQTLERRISRGTAVPLRTMLGRARMTNLIASSVLQLGLAVVLLVATSGWFRWLYLATVLIAYALTAFGIRQATARPTLALDPSSLAIDERLRGEDAFQAAYPLYLLSYMLFQGAAAANTPSWLFPLTFAVATATLGLWFWAANSRPWKALPAAQQGALALWTASSPSDENPYARR